MDEVAVGFMWAALVAVLFWVVHDYATLKARVTKLEKSPSHKPDRMIHYYDRSKN